MKKFLWLIKRSSNKAATKTGVTILLYYSSPYFRVALITKNLEVEA